MGYLIGLSLLTCKLNIVLSRTIKIDDDASTVYIHILRMCVNNLAISFRRHIRYERYASNAADVRKLIRPILNSSRSRNSEKPAGCAACGNCEQRFTLVTQQRDYHREICQVCKQWFVEFAKLVGAKVVICGSAIEQV